MYVSSFGSLLWTNACGMSPVLGITFNLTIMEMNRRSSICDRTGTKQSCFDHGCGSRLPRATILYLALTGCPFLSVFIVAIAIVESQISLSVGCIFRCFSNEVGAFMSTKSLAETCLSQITLATTLDKALHKRALRTCVLFFQPWIRFYLRSWNQLVVESLWVGIYHHFCFYL